MVTTKIRKRFTGGDPKTWVETKTREIESRNRETLTSAIRDGSQLTKEHISTRGVGGKQGRIDTARMVGAVSDRVSERTRDNWTGAFGWINEKDPYFLYQEGGFKHVFSGKEIPAMYALSDAAAQVWDQLKQDLKENAQNA